MTYATFNMYHNIHPQSTIRVMNIHIYLIWEFNPKEYDFQSYIFTISFCNYVYLSLSTTFYLWSWDSSYLLTHKKRIKYINITGHNEIKGENIKWEAAYMW